MFLSFSRGKIVINSKIHRHEMLQSRIPELKNLYEVKLIQNHRSCTEE